MVIFSLLWVVRSFSACICFFEKRCNLCPGCPGVGPVRPLAGGSKNLFLASSALPLQRVRVRGPQVETEKYRFSGSRFSNCVDAFATVRCPRRDGGEASAAGRRREAERVRAVGEVLGAGWVAF